MTIKFVDKNGSLSVKNIDDDADLSVYENNDGTFDIECHKSAHTSKAGKLYRKVIVLETDKATADKCVERIYDQVIAKKDFCDLVEIQLGNSVEDAPIDENE